MPQADSARSQSKEIAGPARFIEGAILAPGMEILLLFMVCLSPWALGGEGAEYEFSLYVGLAALLVLWAARTVARRRFSWRKCPVALTLAMVFIVGIVQLAPLSKTVLAWVSPATARMYDRLLPVQAEVLPAPESPDFASDPSNDPPLKSTGATISLYPDATRKALVRILAVFLLFVVVRNEIASPAALRRLGVAVLVNGALLSLFGLVQFFSSRKPGTVYWTIPSEGQVFGPFVNRNHFAFYINISIGLALGLLLERGRRSGKEHGRRDGGDAGGALAAARDLFRDPASLWIGGGLALMFSGVVFSLSRGGFVALLGAATLSLLLRLSRQHGAWRASAVLLSVAAALALLIWFGLDRVESRLSTLWTGEALHDGRGYVVTHAWPLFVQFPLWGTGYGTFQYVEPLYLHTAAHVGKAYIHAHNDYLEDLIEGGVFRLVLRLVAIGLIFRFGYRAFRGHSPQALGALALGALFAFTTIVLHSLVEFGLYLPAIAVLATVVCAHLCALGEQQAPSLTATHARGHRRHRREAEARGESEPRAGDEVAPPRRHEHRHRTLPRQAVRATSDESRSGVFSRGGMVPLVCAATAMLLGGFLCAQGSRAVAIERHLADAVRLAAGPAANRAGEIQYLQAAAALDPEDAELQFALAEADFEIYKRELSVKEAQPEAPGPGAMDPSTNASDRRTSATPEPQGHQRANDHLVAALRYVVRARDLCPLLPRPNARLAVYAGNLRKGDAPSAYMERATFLAPMNPELWYLCGLQELADGRTRKACESWRRSLELSDAFLTPILDESTARLDAAALLSLVLPDRPRLLLVAAEYLYPDQADAAEREPFLKKAITIFDRQSEPLTADDWRTKALVCGALGRPDEAIAAYRAALANDPLNVEWRYEFAALLHEQGLPRESRQEVRALLDQQPRHGGGRQLADVLAREEAAGVGRRKSAPGRQQTAEGDRP
ncbi:MAG TPA: O-antigen ligase family protein [Pirellulales bacterium]|nr:O-antigen ligase family protein [Pirellulales bacterium]